MKPRALWLASRDRTLKLRSALVAVQWMMMWVIFLMIAWRINVFLLFLHADGNTDNFLVNTRFFL